MEKLYEVKSEERLLSALQNDLSKTLKKSLAKVRRRKESLIRDRVPPEKADEFRKTGDLILANLNQLKRGIDEALLRGYDGKSMLVKLDPKRSPGQNAEQYFKKYKKAKSGRAVISERLQQARDEEQYLESLLGEIAASKNPEDLEDLKNRIQGTPGPVSLRGRKHEDRMRMPAFRKTLFQGWEILVGRSAAGNDYITTRLARNCDLWLHAEGMPGSHVLIRNPSDAEIPPDVLLKAASFAAYFSKGRGSGKVPVAYTRASNVKKPKGAKPGSVVLSERKSVMAAPEELT
jgi:predicted ribosome quality control (RQC) complex YloA/Tae2 family protein